MEDKEKIKILEKIIKDTFFMARRYAHGRNTYAPGIVREAYHKLKEMGIEIKKDKTIDFPAEFKVMSEDYLDDINL